MLKRPWMNFARVCAWCEKEGRPDLLGPLEYSPAYEKFTVSHGACRYHALKCLIGHGGVATWTDKKEFISLSIERFWGDVKSLGKTLWNFAKTVYYI